MGDGGGEEGAGWEPICNTYFKMRMSRSMVGIKVVHHPPMPMNECFFTISLKFFLPANPSRIITCQFFAKETQQWGTIISGWPSPSRLLFLPYLQNSFMKQAPLFSIPSSSAEASSLPSSRATSLVLIPKQSLLPAFMMYILQVVSYDDSNLLRSFQLILFTLHCSQTNFTVAWFHLNEFQVWEMYAFIKMMMVLLWLQQQEAERRTKHYYNPLRIAISKFSRVMNKSL